MTDKELQEAEILVKFLHATKDGLIKPYDHSAYVKKLKNAGYSDEDIPGCCPPSADIRDAKDFKPYILAALVRFADLMGLEVRKNRYE